MMLERVGAEQGVFYWPIRVYYEDTDAGGIVFYANYLKFFERARTEMLREKGIEQDDWLSQQIAFVVRKVEMDNRAAARFNQQLSVHTVIAQIRGASMQFEQQIYNSQNQLICSARVKIACVNLATMTPVAIPEPILAVISE